MIFLTMSNRDELDTQPYLKRRESNKRLKLS